MLKFLSICYFQSHFHLSSTVEVNKMYERFEELVA